MLFSGQIQRVKCNRCGHEIVRQYTTSCLYWFALLSLACAVMFPVVARTFGKHGWYALVVIVGEVLLLTLIVAVAFKLDARELTPGLKCPQCSGQLENAGAGFYDGLVPSRHDVLVGIAFFFIHVFIIALILRLK